jgi:RNA polymerase sigma factor (sigma-70 family)
MPRERSAIMGHAVTGVVQRLRNVLAVRDAAEQSDADLLSRFASKADAAAFEAIVRRHGPMVLGVCRRFLHDSADADDSFQATFAILFRKASSLSRPERLAGWLFQVAYRTARRARSLRFRDQARQLPMPDLAVESHVAEIVWRELQPIFDEELARLPEKLRLPVVLCFLEGRPKRAAAHLLGWPEGTFSCRLQQARELLRARLARRGVALSAGTLALALFEGSASAMVPAALISAITNSAALVATGTALPAPIAALTQGVIHSMFATKLKIVAAVAMAVGVLGGGTGWILQSAGNGTGSAFAGDSGPESGQTKSSPGSSVSQYELAALQKEIEAVTEQLKAAKEQLVYFDANVRIEEAGGGANKKQAIEQRDRHLKFIKEVEANLIKLRERAALMTNARKKLQIQKEDLRSEQAAEAKILAAKEDENALLKKQIEDLTAQLQVLQNRAEVNRARAADREKLAALDVLFAQAEADAKEAEGSLKQAETVLKQKELEFARFKDLLKLNQATKIDVDKALADLEGARAQLFFAQANLQAARAKAAPQEKNGIMTRPIKFIDVRAAADSLSKALNDPLTPLRITFDERTNTIFVQGPPDVLAKAKKLLEEMDKKEIVGRASTTPTDVLVEEADVRQREADLQVAKAKLQFKAVEAARFKELAAKNVIAQATIEKAVSDLAISEAEFKQAEAALDRAKAVLQRARERDRSQTERDAKAKEPAMAELKERFEWLQQMKKKGFVSEAEVNRGRVALAEARIAVELRAIVDLRQQDVSRMKQLLEKNAIGPDEVKKAVDALEAAKQRLNEWKQ